MRQGSLDGGKDGSEWESGQCDMGEGKNEAGIIKETENKTYHHPNRVTATCDQVWVCPAARAGAEVDVHGSLDARAGEVEEAANLGKNS